MSENKWVLGTRKGEEIVEATAIPVQRYKEIKDGEGTKPVSKLKRSVKCLRKRRARMEVAGKKLPVEANAPQIWKSTVFDGKNLDGKQN